MFTGYKYKEISKEGTNKYVTIHIYDREVLGNESVNDSSRCYFQQQWHTAISLILSTFEGVLVLPQTQQHTSN